MGDKCKHGYKDGEYCLMCDKPEYIKLLEFEHKSLQAENAKLRDELFQSEGGRIRQRSEIAKLKAKLEGAEEENCMLQNQLDIQPSFSSAEEQEAHFTLTEGVAERLREKGE